METSFLVFPIILLKEAPRQKEVLNCSKTVFHSMLLGAPPRQSLNMQSSTMRAYSYKHITLPQLVKSDENKQMYKEGISKTKQNK